MHFWHRLIATYVSFACENGALHIARLPVARCPFFCAQSPTQIRAPPNCCVKVNTSQALGRQEGERALTRIISSVAAAPHFTPYTRTRAVRAWTDIDALRRPRRELDCALNNDGTVACHEETLAIISDGSNVCLYVTTHLPCACAHLPTPA